MALQLQAPKPTAHWRDSARPVKFFIIDAQAGFPVLLFLMHIRVWTFIIAVIAMAFFTTLSHYGFSVPVFARAARAFLAGKRKDSFPWWMRGPITK